MLVLLLHEPDTHAFHALDALEPAAEVRGEALGLADGAPRALAVRDDGGREAVACLGAAFRQAPLRLDVLAEWCAASAAPAAYRQGRRSRMERR